MATKMETAEPARPALRYLPGIAPHLRGSAVLRMLQEEDPQTVGEVATNWPPQSTDISRPQGFMGKICTGKGPGGRPVEWPPRPEPGSENEVLNNVSNTTTTTSNNTSNTSEVPPPVPPRPANYPQVSSMEHMQQQQHHQQQMSTQQHHQQQQHQQQHHQVNDGPNMTTTYPSGFKFKDQTPGAGGAVRVVTSQPAFKISQPMRKRGDDQWPPKSGAEQPQVVRQFIKPKKSNKNYQQFFAQNALPHNYSGYRAPPGTQHVGVDGEGEEEEEEEEDEDAHDM